MKKLLKDPSEKYCKKCKPIYKKETTKSMWFSIIGLFIIILIGFSFFLFPYKMKADKVALISAEPIYERISDNYENDEIVQTLANLCSHFERDKDKLTCVNQFVKNFFNYETEMIGLKPIRYPDEIINHGGVCRDYSVFYKSVLTVMGFETEFIFEPTHVYLRIYTDEKNYLLDQKTLWEEESFERKENITITTLPAREIEFVN